MTQNLFEELQEKKGKLLHLAEKAAEFGWIPEKRTNNIKKANNVISLEEIKEKLDKDTLTIGVIGQMKCGKSTFLNSFVFEDDVLPVATTPMTAALSVITYGENKRIFAEFYTKDEWEDLKMQASRDENDAADSKIKAAKELVSKAGKLAVDKYLGKTQEDSFENLIEYVGADGKFVSITKSVTIYYPHKYLKGVEVVDTPGFNDPIVEREERTKEFLKKADAVIMLLYAGRPFDATDRDVLFKNVRQCGTGKVLVGINKYDIPFCSETNPEDENQIKEYVKTEINKACREFDDNTLDEILKDVEPIPLSAEMALLSALPMSKITSTESLNFAYKRHCSNFGIGTQKELYQLSHISDLIAAIKNLVENEKNKILFAKSLRAIEAAGEKIENDNEKELTLINSKIKLLKMPDSDIDKKEDALVKAKKRLSKKINSLGEDCNEEIRDLVLKGRYELEDNVDKACNKLSSIIENDWKWYNKGYGSIKHKCDRILQNLITRDLRRACEDLAEKGKRKIRREIGDFFVDAEDILMKYLPDFDSRDFVKSTQMKVQMELGSSELFTLNNSQDEEFSMTELFGDVFKGVLDDSALGLFSALLHTGTHSSQKQDFPNVVNAILHTGTHSIQKQDLLNKVNAISRGFNPDPYLDSAFARKDEIIASTKQAFITELIEPLLNQIVEIRSKKNNKEKELQKLEQEKDELEEKKALVKKQISSISELKT